MTRWPGVVVRAASRADRVLLRTAGRLVPMTERAEWRRSWEAELWHCRHRTTGMRRRAGRPWATAELAGGLLRDAMWLRAEGWQRFLRGTALLTLLWLSGLCVLAGVLGVVLAGGPQALALRLAGLLPQVALAAVLVSFVSVAVAPRRPTEEASAGGTAVWLRRQGYLVAKGSLSLSMALLLSFDLTDPLCAPHPAVAAFLEILAFVLLSLVGLRWALADGERRCKFCLRSLAAPARVGRPSRNLLEWSGTELACIRGHGRLTIPELETSWCQRSAWVARGRSLRDGAAT